MHSQPPGPRSRCNASAVPLAWIGLRVPRSSAYQRGEVADGPWSYSYAEWRAGMKKQNPPVRAMSTSVRQLVPLSGVG